MMENAHPWQGHDGGVAWRLGRGSSPVGTVFLQGQVVLPPTETGWKSYLELAPASEPKFTELDQAGEYWWDRRVPRDLLSKERKAAEAEGQRGAA